MSQGYGLDLYGIPFYGYSQPEDYSVSPFTAQQTDYGKISLFWASPNSTPWKFLELVRSTSGYPSTPADGVVLLDISAQSMVRTYDDVEVIPGNIYYYTMFIAIDAPAYSSSVTYQENSQVLYNGQYWGSIQNGNTGNTPGVASAFWQSATFIPVWYPAGYTATMALANQGYGTRLYQRTPQPYKIDTSDTFSNTTTIDNPSLQHYLNVFGFGLDILKNSYDSFLNLNNPDKLSAYNLDILGQQFGLTTDYLSSPGQRRQRISNVSINYQMKGQTQSIHNLIAELSGWDTSITYGPNIMISSDQTAFVHPSYDQWSAYVLYKSGQFIQYNGYNYSCATTQAYGQAQAPTGTATSNTWWTLSQQVLNTTVNLNNGTLGQSTWSIAGFEGLVACAISGVMTGIAHPTNLAINNWNALASVQTTGFNTASYDLFSISDLSVSAWSSGTNYVRGNYVTYTDGYTYKALKSSGPAIGLGAVIPGRDNSVWEAVYYLTGDVPNKYTDTAPLVTTPTWYSTVAYVPGQIVSYNGNIYRCALAGKNKVPSLGYYSSPYWTFLYSNQDTYVLSTYAAHVNNASFLSMFVGISPYFYATNGTLLNNTASNLSGYGVSQFAYTARFATDYPDLSGTGEASLYNAFNNETLNTSTWAATPATAGLWRSSFGMASVSPTMFTSNTYSVLLVQQSPARTGNAGISYGRYGLTFANDYTNSAQLTHGFVFAYKDINNFYYVTRTSLRKVVAGVDSILSSWTRLKTGDRVLVDVTNNICVYKYKRTGDGGLQILANSIGTGPVTTTGSFYSGLIHKYSPTGDL